MNISAVDHHNKTDNTILKCQENTLFVCVCFGKRVLAQEWLEKLEIAGFQLRVDSFRFALIL